MAPNIELTLFMLRAPPELAEKSKADAGKVCLVTATIFADTMAEAEASLKPLDGCPVMSKCLSKTVKKPCNFEGLFDGSEALWPANLRNQVEAIFSNAKLEDLCEAVEGHFLKTPSPTTLMLFAIYTGPNIPAPLPDAAFSMSAHYYGDHGQCGQKRRTTKPTPNGTRNVWICLNRLWRGIMWVNRTRSAIRKYAEESYTANNWKRLQELRKKYDPDGVFFSYSDGLG